MRTNPGRRQALFKSMDLLQVVRLEGFVRSRCLIPCFARPIVVRRSIDRKNRSGNICVALVSGKYLRTDEGMAGRWADRAVRVRNVSLVKLGLWGRAAQPASHVNPHGCEVGQIARRGRADMKWGWQLLSGLRSFQVLLKNRQIRLRRFHALQVGWVSGKAIEFSAQHGEVHVIVAVSRIVVGVRVAGLEIDEGRDPFGMTRADGTEFSPPRE
jgi:hypothetical protein